MNIAINDGYDVKDFLWRWLKLDGHTIIFHMIDVGDEEPHICGGIITGEDDLNDSDAYYDIGYDRCDEKEIEVFEVESLMIGDGEAWDADSGDCEILSQMMREHPIAFDDFIGEFSEALAIIKPNRPLPNPAYDGDEDGDDDV